MIDKLITMLNLKRKKEPTTDFSTFFHSASSAEKKKLLMTVVRESNKDQRDLVRRYDTMNAA